MNYKEASELMLSAGNYGKKVIEEAGVYKAIDDKIDGYNIIENKVDGGLNDLEQLLKDIVNDGFFVDSFEIDGTDYAVKLYVYDCRNWGQIYPRTYNYTSVSCNIRGLPTSRYIYTFYYTINLFMVMFRGDTPLYGRLLQNLDSQLETRPQTRNVSLRRTDPDYAIYGSYYPIYYPLYKVDLIGVEVTNNNFYIPPPSTFGTTAKGESIYFKGTVSKRLKITPYIYTYSDNYDIGKIEEDTPIETLTTINIKNYTIYNYPSNLAIQMRLAGDHKQGPIFGNISDAEVKGIIDSLNPQIIRLQNNAEGYNYYILPAELQYP